MSKELIGLIVVLAVFAVIVAVFIITDRVRERAFLDGWDQGHDAAVEAMEKALGVRR